ncbi:uncharacterized protein LOC114141322 [Xiphophorus couchianus]|uniref:uncharacterized protein LOC114141322 n=1 Tax=Xiphophorus couchianus TaxID=32473 RepID=UPI00101631D6|nr:uncharacterized protein LOC114141322 [Xiphophorus couchianus]
MTASKFKNRCPVCQSKSWRLRSHLDDVHSVRNAQERRILLAFARGRVSVRGMKCPISGCTYGGSRVAQHLLDAHRDLGAKEKRRHLRKLQWRKTLRQVRELRASGPDPPLATRLDLDGSEGSKAAAAAATGSPPPPPASSPPSQAEPCPSPPHSTSADSPQRPETSLPGGLGTSADVPAAGPVVELEMTGVPQTRAEPQAPSSSTVSKLLTFPPVIRGYLEEYDRHLTGAVRSRKHLENVKSKMGRIVAFLSYMSRDKTALGSWRFLDDAGRITGWPAELSRQQKAVTTVKVYLVNTTQFHVYFMETPPRSSRLSKRQLVSVMRALRSATCQIGTKVVLRQIKVKSEKLQRSVTPDLLLQMSRKISELDPQTLAELLAKEARRGSETPALRIRCALPYFSLRPSSRRDDQPYHRRGPGGREGHQLFLSGGRTQCLSHPRGTGLDPAVDGDQGSATPAVRSGIFQYQPPAREKHHPVREERVGSHATARQTLPYRHPDRRRDDVQEHPLQ